MDWNILFHAKSVLFIFGAGLKATILRFKPKNSDLPQYRFMAAACVVILLLTVLVFHISRGRTRDFLGDEGDLSQCSFSSLENGINNDIAVGTNNGTGKGTGSDFPKGTDGGVDKIGFVLSKLFSDNTSRQNIMDPGALLLK